MFINHVINHLQSLRFIGPPQWDDENPTPHLWPVGWDGLLLGLQIRNWNWEFFLLSRNYIYMYIIVFFSWGTKLLSCILIYIYVYIYILCIYIIYIIHILIELYSPCLLHVPLIPWPTEHRNDGHQRRAWAEANEAPAQAEAAGTSKVPWKWWFIGDLPIENGDFP